MTAQIFRKDIGDKHKKHLFRMGFYKAIILTDSALRESPFLKFGQIRPSVGPCVSHLEIRTDSGRRRIRARADGGF